MTDEGKYKPPETSTGDTAHLVASGVMSLIPGLPELFQYFISPPLEKRRKRWMEDVGGALRNLEEHHGINLEELQNNDIFIDTVLQATQIASRNSQEEKRNALKNAVINASLPNPPDESVQLMFLNLIDTFTVWHLRILSLLQNPREWFNKNNKQAPSFSLSSSISQLIASAYPELEAQFYLLVINELNSKGFVSISGSHVNTMMSASGAFENRTTNLGNKFLQFINAPINQ